MEYIKMTELLFGIFLGLFGSLMLIQLLKVLQGIREELHRMNEELWQGKDHPPVRIFEGRNKPPKEIFKGFKNND